MLVLGASHAHVDALGAHGFELGAGLGHVCLGADSAGKATLGQIKLVFEIGDGSVEQRDLGVETAQLEVVGGHLGMEAEVYVCLVSGAGLGVGAGGFDGAADASPEVRLPTRLAAQRKVAVCRGFTRRIRGTIGRNLFALGANSGRECGVESGPGCADLVARDKISFQGLAQGGVLDGDALFQLVELRVLIDLPPFAAKHSVRGRSRLPTSSGRWGRRLNDRGRASLLIGRGSIVAGAAVVGTDRLATGEQSEGSQTG